MGKRRSLQDLMEAEYVSIGELARLTDTRYSTLKYYTEEGLLTYVQAGENRTRRYHRLEATRHLERIKELRQQNRTIEEIKAEYPLEKKDNLPAMFLSLLDQDQKIDVHKLNKVLYVLDYYQNNHCLPKKVEANITSVQPDRKVEKNIYYLKQAIEQTDLKEEVQLLLWGLRLLGAWDYVLSRFEIRKVESKLMEMALTRSFSKELGNLRL